MANQAVKHKASGVTILVLMFSVFLISAGLINIFYKPSSGLFEILSGLVIFPPLWQFAKVRCNFSLPGWVKAIIFIIIFAASGTATNNTISSTTHSDSPTNAEEITVNKLTTQQAFTATPAPTTKPLTLEEKIRNALPESMSEVSIDLEDAQDFKTFAPINGKTDIMIDANHTGTYWNVQITKEATWSEAKDIIQKVFPLDDKIHGIIILNEVPITTAYGKKDKSMLTTISISRDTYTKIEFKDFDYKNIPTIADSYGENHNIKD